MKKNIAVLLLLGGFLSACSQTPVNENQAAENVAPAWTVSTQDDDGQFLYAKGQAPLTLGQEAAIAQAKEQANENLWALVRGKLQPLPTTDRMAVDKTTSPFETKLLEAIESETQPFAMTLDDVDKVYVDEKVGVVFAQAKLPKADVRQALSERLNQLDAQLTDYVHLSSAGRTLNQLLSLLPAMPTLNERARLKTELEAFQGQAVTLPNDQLASLLNGRMARLMEEIVVNLDASTPETRRFEKAFQKALASQGFSMSARKPDLTFKYFIESSHIQKGVLYQVSLIGDLEMIDAQDVTVATISDEYTGENIQLEAATDSALLVFADEATDTIVKTSVDYMNKVNHFNYNR